MPLTYLPGYLHNKQQKIHLSTGYGQSGTPTTWDLMYLLLSEGSCLRRTCQELYHPCLLLRRNRNDKPDEWKGKALRTEHGSIVFNRSLMIQKRLRERISWFYQKQNPQYCYSIILLRGYSLETRHNGKKNLNRAQERQTKTEIKKANDVNQSATALRWTA